MRPLIRVSVVFISSVVMALGASGTAAAKGPSAAVIDGPGMSSPIRLPGPNETNIGPELAALISDSGVLAGLWCSGCDERLRSRPDERLGPRYTVTYTMAAIDNRTRRPNRVVQYIYPDATPNPVTYIPPGQPFWNETTVGGWFKARPRLRRVLVDLGVSMGMASPRPAGVAAADQGGISIRFWFLLAAPIVFLGGLTLTTHRARRRAPGSPAASQGSDRRER